MDGGYITIITKKMYGENDEKGVIYGRKEKIQCNSYKRRK